MEGKKGWKKNDGFHLGARDIFPRKKFRDF